MSFTASSNDTKNIRMGTCVVLYNDVELGYTIGGVEVEVTTTTKEIKVDQFGDVVANEYIMGRNVMAKCPMAETSLQLMADTMPGATLVGDATSGRVEVKTGTGLSLLDLAQELVLRPLALHDETTPDKSEDFVIHRAAAPGALQFAYKYDEERVFMLEFKGYPQADGKLFSYGDPDAV